MHKFKLPIGATTGAGYFLIIRDGELSKYLTTLQNRAYKILERGTSVAAYYYQSQGAILTPDLYDEDEEEED